jgi:hypothetical protein
VVNQFAQLPNGEIWISDAWNSIRPLLDERDADNRHANTVRIPGVPVMMVDKAGSIWLANDFRRDYANQRSRGWVESN